MYQNNRLTFWMETLAVESFGFAWLIKGETMFKDDPEYMAMTNTVEGKTS